MDLKFLEDDDLKIQDNQNVFVKECGNVIITKYIEKTNNKCWIKKISDTQYLNLKTGEVCDFDKSNNRSESYRSLKNSMENLRNLINCNVVNIQNCRWVTITYKENMTDTKQLYEDTKKFIKKVRYKFGHFEYVNVAEPQGRGAWHLHCIWIFDKKAPYIDQKWLADCWGHGDNVTVKKLDDDNDNLGSYLTAYLCDVELTEDTPIDVTQHMQGLKEVEIEDDNGNKITKRYAKGARLHMYPPKFNLFRVSRGIKRPVEYQTQYKNIKEKIGSAKPTFVKGYTISDDNVLSDKTFTNTIITEYYNTKRK